LLARAPPGARPARRRRAGRNTLNMTSCHVSTQKVESSFDKMTKTRVFGKNSRFSLKTPSKRSFEGVLREKWTKISDFLIFFLISLKTPSNDLF
jgi:hypothetical protein